ncbi:serine/threonine-protein kinase-like protein ccr1 [Phtheirospermum japonicum]|uniref:non-specific serine/threonine protein kinase n=1 Tax=Phtheirospermum japonicum TaxID=374723 RepID=A0A830BFW4_9LAMI|nr:serine/threonine-protein kinase-like protein ccr1 [Phtheirospermum japonicum]
MGPISASSGDYGLFCAIDASGKQAVICWDANNSSTSSASTSLHYSTVLPPMAALSGGEGFLCGILSNTSQALCWDSSGIREGDLVLDCWFANLSSPVDYDPPLQLCSPGLCTAGACGEGMFAFNASLLNEPDLTSLCVRKDLRICSPCGLNCSEGFFPSSLCTSDADRICTPCSLCQNSSCGDICKLESLRGTRKIKRNWDQLHQLFLIIGSAASGFFLILLAWCLLPRAAVANNEEGEKKRCCLFPCVPGPGPRPVPDPNADQHPPASVAPCPGVAQIFRLSELKDATNGFKEFNELGRGSYGFVYKAVLADGRPVAVKRANAATIIHTNSRDFETELEILCNVRHSNIVNLLGYCAEMGERLLVYEYMPHGSLHDHLHGGLSTLNWTLRLKIAMQAAKGLEYLHKEVVPPIVHREVKSSKILLDVDWGARIADFGLLTPSERDIAADMRMDVYGFGVVLLEILSGRKAYDGDCVPPDIVDWALPQIKHGKAAAVIDRYAALPRNVEPLLKLADIAELALREEPNKRASMSDLTVLLEQLVKDGLIL